MDNDNWIAVALALLGFGFSAWAFMVKKAIGVIEQLSTSLTSIDKRVFALEIWVKHQEQLKEL